MRYIVAKANATAMPFVARSEKMRDGWIVLSRHEDYSAAQRACANGGDLPVPRRSRDYAQGRSASRAEQYARYIDSGHNDDIGPSPDY